MTGAPAKTPELQPVAPHTTKERSVRKRRAIESYVLRAVLGIGILAFVLSRLDRAQLIRLISRERPAYFFGAAAIYVCGQMVAACRWKWLARMLGLIGSYGEFLLYFFIGAFTNLFVPGLVGGDAARAIYLGRRHHEIGKAVASVLADRIFGLLVLVWLTAACVAILGRGIFPHTVTAPVLITGIVTLIGYLAMPLVASLKKVVPARLGSTIGVLAPYLDGQIAVIPALVLSLLLHLIQVLAQYVLGLGLELRVPFRLFLLCVPTTNTLASLPLTFNGLGLREGLYVVLFGMAGVGKADAAALGLLWFAITTFAGLCASAAFFLVPTPLERPAGQE